MAIVETQISDGVAEVLLNRPDKKNALSEAMFEEIADAGARLQSQPDVRAVILAGAGGDFSAGLDMALMAEMGGRIDEIRSRLLNPADGEQANWFQKPCTVWAELPVPVIAAIEGVCLGGGLQIALGADVRVAAPTARLSIMEAKWGLIPDMGITQSLPKVMRADRAKQLIIEADVFSGERALAEGLVTEVADDPIERARQIAEGFAKRSPEVLAGVKRLVDQSWTMPPGAGLRLEAEIQSPIIGGPNQLEAVMAGMQKRAPRFK